MGKKYVVTAAAVVAKVDSETGEGYFYRDAVLPAAGSAAVRANHAWLAESGLVKEVSEESGEPRDKWTVDQLTVYAEQRSIDLGDAKLKADILAKIDQAEQA